jgi:hypothetical protein
MTANAVLLTSVPAQGEVAIDWARKILYVPTTQKQANGQGDVAKLGIDYAEFGSSPVGASTSSAVPTVVNFSFNGNATPAQFVIEEPGISTPDFAISGGTCTTGVVYAANTGCYIDMTMTPTAVGSLSAKLLLENLVPNASGTPDAADSVTGFTYTSTNTSTVLTLTSKNTLSAGEVVSFSAGKTDGLFPLNGKSFTVLAAGLSGTQFEISTSLVTAASGTSTATATGYNYTPIASIGLHGTGTGALAQVAPAATSAIGNTLKAPSQVAVDQTGNVYVADSGLGKVLMYAEGSSATSTPFAIGSGLTTPTGVAVDGAGDVFIADSGSSSVYEVPFGTNASTGIESGLNKSGQLTLVSGLGTSGLNLAVDGLGNLYIADPTKGRIVKLSGIGASTANTLGQSQSIITAGLTAPSAVAVDSNSNLYVIDGANLFEFQGGLGAPSTLLNNLSGATGLAVDASGAVYISSANGTTRIPASGGVLVPANETAIAATVSNTSSVAVDHWGNTYLTQATGGGVTFVGTNGSMTGAFALPTPATLTSSTSENATVTDAGNATLSVTGYTTTNTESVNWIVLTPVDFTAADTTTGGCEAGSPVAVGGTCSVDVTFSPGPGEQGTLTATIGIKSNAVDTPVTINTSGKSNALAASVTSATVGSSAQVINTPITVTVASGSGTGAAPTGEVTVTYMTWNVVVPTSTGVPTVTPVTVTATGTLKAGTGSTSTVTFNLSPVLAGSQTFSVAYSGDRAYGRSSGSVTATVAKSAISGFTADPNPPPYLPFVLQSNGAGLTGSIPYDGTATYWQYSMPVTVNTAAGIPTGTLTFMDNSSTCPPGTSATGQGAAICALSNYSGIACPESAGSGVINVQNNGTTATGAEAQFSTTCLPMPLFTTYTPVVSTHYITPVYSGDANFVGATDPVSTLFQALRSPLVTISSNPSSLSVTAGSTASATLTITSIDGYGYAGHGSTLNNFNLPVTLTCDNLPPHAACSFTYPTTVSSLQPTAPNSVQIPCSGSTSAADDCLPGTVTITINTDVSAGTSTSQNTTAASVTLASIFGFGMIGLFLRRKAFEKGRNLLIVFLMIVGAALSVSLTACNTTNLGSNAVLTSTPGTYAVTVTAEQVGQNCIASANNPNDNCTTSSGAAGVAVYGTENQVSLPFYINVTVQ